MLLLCLLNVLALLVILHLYLGGTASGSKLGAPVPVSLSLGRSAMFLRSDGALPAYFRYKESLLVPVRSQRSCAACWAFSIADMLADTLSVLTGGGFREHLSAQYLLACSHQPEGCTEGASPEDVLVMPEVTERGIPLEKDYAYEARTTACPFIGQALPRFRFKRGTMVELCEDPARAMGWSKQSVIRRNIRNMKLALMEYGPIISAIEVREDLYRYSGDRVYTMDRASPYIGMHAVEIVGWRDAGLGGGTEPYWIFRSSWGKDWGGPTAGFGHVKMGENMAQIESRACVARVEIPEWLEQTARRTDIRSCVHIRHHQ